MSLSRLEERAGRKHRKKKRRGEPFPIDSTASGGGKKSKRKGAKFEGAIAKLFANYLGCGVRRTPLSGGWASAGSFGPTGDLVFSIKKIKWHIECKRQEGWDLADLITGVRALDKTSTNSLEKWWAQTIRDCPKKKYPMLVFARNLAKSGKGKNVGVPPLLMMWQDDFRKVGTTKQSAIQFEESEDGFGNTEKIPIPKIAMWCAADFIPHLTFTNDTGTRIVCLLSDFFKFVKPPKCSPRRKQWKRGIG